MTKRGIKLYYSNKSNVIHAITPELKDLIDDYKLDFDPNKNIVLLTKNNAKKIENLIQHDPNYFPFSKIIFDSFTVNDIKINNNNALFAVIREIDRDSNTNVWRYNNRSSFFEIINYIIDPKNDFFIKLDKGDIKLPDLICKKCGTGIKSLSSKVCKYLSEFMYKKDNYYINDTYIRRALLFYLDYYGENRQKSNGTILATSWKVYNLSYKELFLLLEKLNNARNKKHNDGQMTKNELDHIIWYCYKSFDA